MKYLFDFFVYPFASNKVSLNVGIKKAIIHFWFSLVIQILLPILLFVVYSLLFESRIDTNDFFGLIAYSIIGFVSLFLIFTLDYFLMKGIAKNYSIEIPFSNVLKLFSVSILPLLLNVFSNGNPLVISVFVTWYVFLWIKGLLKITDSNLGKVIVIFGMAKVLLGIIYGILMLVLPYIITFFK